MDKIICCTLTDHPVRFYIAVTTQAVEKMNELHQTTPTAAAAAGRVLTGTALMGAMLKYDDNLLTVTVKGDGEIKRITATADRNGNIKCEILNPATGIYLNEKGKLDVRRVVGSGSLSVIKDIGLKQPYVGQVELPSGEIAEDFAYYFAKSEQTPSIVSLGVFVLKDYSVAAAGGFIVQLMPDCGDEMISYLENKSAQIKSVTQMLLEGYDELKIAEEIFGGMPYEITRSIEVNYICNCSEEKIIKVLTALGKEELEDIIAEGKSIELRCHFCNTLYTMPIEKIQEILRGTNE